MTRKAPELIDFYPSWCASRRPSQHVARSRLRSTGASEGKDPAESSTAAIIWECCSSQGLIDGHLAEINHLSTAWQLGEQRQQCGVSSLSSASVCVVSSRVGLRLSVWILRAPCLMTRDKTRFYFFYRRPGQCVVVSQSVARLPGWRVFILCVYS